MEAKLGRAGEGAISRRQHPSSGPSSLLDFSSLSTRRPQDRYTTQHAQPSRQASHLTAMHSFHNALPTSALCRSRVILVAQSHARAGVYRKRARHHRGASISSLLSKDSRAIWHSHPFIQESLTPSFLSQLSFLRARKTTFFSAILVEWISNLSTMYFSSAPALLSLSLTFFTLTLAHDEPEQKKEEPAPKAPFRFKRCTHDQKARINEATQAAVEWNKFGLEIPDGDSIYTRMFASGYENVHKLQEKMQKVMTEKEDGKKIKVICRDPGRINFLAHRTIKKNCLSLGEKPEDHKDKEM